MPGLAKVIALLRNNGCHQLEKHPPRPTQRECASRRGTLRWASGEGTPLSGRRRERRMNQPDQLRAPIAGQGPCTVSPLMHGQVIPNATYLLGEKEESQPIYAAASQNRLRSPAKAYYSTYIRSAIRMGRSEEPVEPAKTRRDFIRTGNAGLRRRTLPSLHGSYRRSHRRAKVARPWDGATRPGRRHLVTGCTRVPGGRIWRRDHPHHLRAGSGEV